MDYKKEDIVFIEYNGAGRPWAVFTSELEGFDAFKKDGDIRCTWCSQNVSPFLNDLAPEWKEKEKIKIWFLEEFRPTNNSFKETHVLTDQEISEMGYVRINEPKWIDEILTALNFFDHYI